MPDSGIVIFGGTAAYDIDPADVVEVAATQVVETPYGCSPRFLRLMTEAGTAVWFGSRHGEDRLARSARFVNHRANLWAVQALGATAVLSWNGVGAINPELRVGEMIVPAGLMDWTRNRTGSFEEESPHFERAEQLRRAARTIAHIENGREAGQVAYAFDEQLRQMILYQVSSVEGQVPGIKSLHSPLATRHSPIYVCTEGPRLETAAEIRLAADLGADVVGMTLCPEVWLAAELGLAYASLCLVTNFATGRWHIDPRREFGPQVAERALELLLAVADERQGSRGAPLRLQERRSGGAEEQR
jgi:5'-methylthioadenosine phosphorylase